MHQTQFASTSTHSVVYTQTRGSASFLLVGDSTGCRQVARRVEQLPHLAIRSPSHGCRCSHQHGRFVARKCCSHGGLCAHCDPGLSGFCPALAWPLCQASRACHRRRAPPLLVSLSAGAAARHLLETAPAVPCLQPFWRRRRARSVGGPGSAGSQRPGSQPPREGLHRGRRDVRSHLAARQGPFQCGLALCTAHASLLRTHRVSESAWCDCLGRQSANWQATTPPHPRRSIHVPSLHHAGAEPRQHGCRCGVPSAFLPRCAAGHDWCGCTCSRSGDGEACPHASLLPRAPSQALPSPTPSPGWPAARWPPTRTTPPSPRTCCSECTKPAPRTTTTPPSPTQAP